MMKLKEVKEKLYETYKLYWMLQNGYLLDDIHEKFLDLANAYDYDDVKSEECIDSNIDSIFCNFEEQGFLSGNKWKEYNQFFSEEGKNIRYVKTLFHIGCFTEAEERVYLNLLQSTTV